MEEITDLLKITLDNKNIVRLNCKSLILISIKLVFPSFCIQNLNRLFNSGTSVTKVPVEIIKSSISKLLDQLKPWLTRLDITAFNSSRASL